MKLPLVIANWKLNGNKETFSLLLNFLEKNQEKIEKKCNLSISPSYVYLYKFKKIIKKHKYLTLSAQNVDIHLSGSFTGEVSALMLKDMSVKNVLIGHSERRINHYESQHLISKKFFLLKNCNLTPVLCIGETQEERKNNETIEICKKQIDFIFQSKDKNVFNDTVIAYEPIWSIGTGKSADPKEVQFILGSLRNYIRKKMLYSLNNFYLLYGGSINENNIDSFCKRKDIDGFLLGNACLNFDSFFKILEKISK
ncbi:triose-phosphate isomerase [Buchnera aphidicola]|uniref:triose-phosphate isomerase n=1 Tax=Buchnera aphidicola TaxID=9 RepID=UPI0031B80C4B